VISVLGVKAKFSGLGLFDIGKKVKSKILADWRSSRPTKRSRSRGFFSCFSVCKMLRLPTDGT